MTEPTPTSLESRYPYMQPSTDAAHVIKGTGVSRRAAVVRGEIDAAQKRHAQLLGHQKTLLRAFPEDDDAVHHAVRLREIGREIKAVEDELAMLNTRLHVAGELDAEEGVSDATTEFDRHIAVALKHLAARAPHAEKLAAGFKLLQEGLQGYETCNAAAEPHLHEAARQLPRKLRTDLVHNIGRHVAGAEGIHALMHAIRTCGLGQTGITAGILLDTGGQIPHETFSSALSKCNARIAGMLARWRPLALGEERQAPTVEA